MSKVYRLSFLSFDALPLLDPSVRHGIGGAEVRAVTFARGLRRLDAERGARYAFNFIVRKPDRGPTKRSGSSPVNSKSILAGGPANPVAFPIHYYEKSGTSFLGKLTNSIAKRLGGFGFGEQQPTSDNFFANLQSDVLLCFGIRNDTAKFVRAAKESGKRSVVFLTSDRNIDDAMRRGSRKRGVYGEIGHFCRYALMNADCVVTQSAFQQQQLQERLQIESQLIRNPIELDSYLDHGIETTQAASAEGDSPRVLWVGRADTFSKRADLCLEVAKRCPKVRFKMVMNNHDEATFDEIQRDAPTNVEIIEHVPFREVESHLCFINVAAEHIFGRRFPQFVFASGQIWQAHRFA